MTSKRRTIEALIKDESRKYEAANDRIYTISRRMREQCFDGDFDPTEKATQEANEAKDRIDALQAAMDALPDDRTPEEITEDEDAAFEAQERRNDAHTRRQESGNYEASCPGCSDWDE